MTTKTEILQIKCFCRTKDTISKIKMYTNWEKRFAAYLTGILLISKGTLKNQFRKCKQKKKKGTKRQFTEGETQSDSKYERM